jgi:hypothetical protein
MNLSAAEMIARSGVIFGSRARTMMDPVIDAAGHGGLGISFERQAYLFEVWLEQTGEQLFQSCYEPCSVELFTAEARLNFYSDRATTDQMNRWRDASEEAFDAVSHARAAA